jgi:hypothetical protein
MTRVALLFDNTLRRETTGFYCRRALGKLAEAGRIAEVEHFLPDDIPRLLSEERRWDLCSPSIRTVSLVNSTSRRWRGSIQRPGFVFNRSVGDDMNMRVLEAMGSGSMLLKNALEK